MAEKVKLKLSPAVAALVRPGSGADEKLQGLETATGLSANDRIMLAICLMQDRDAVVKEAARVFFESLPPETVVEFIRGATGVHPAILDHIAAIHYANPDVAEELLSFDALSPHAREFLQRRAGTNPALSEGDQQEDSLSVDEQELDRAGDDDDSPEAEPEAEESDAGTPEEESKEFLSKYKLAQTLGIADKIKMALTGDKEWRSLLIKDANKLVSGSVIRNPRITDAEILSLVKTGVQNDEIMRLICSNKEWVKNIKIRKALVENPRTPVPNALRYLSSLGEKDIAAYAKSKNISSVISTQARRMLLNKKR